ncbi:flagellar assembly protein FliH [Iodidimonas gelatinilytica]|uniref:Flagellar assembly protein FliH n=1 Tax=Iodidimonas gelatinilytica TaxID=1236966 RepID=A0A5A7MX43_9PROT|nr:FliH/SctL family protein [Iodidimonas gelatinilytica]GER00651.1 flagellar assembly protein FliH [Iodidimonas gelatinilytica]
MAPVKYNFDTSFGDSRADAVQEELDALRRQIGEAREEGRREGMATGRTEALGELEARIAQTLDRILASCAEMAKQTRQIEQSLEAQAAKLAHAIAMTLAPSLMRSHPLSEIEALVADCMDGCRREPRIVVRVHESLLDPIQSRLEALKLTGGFAGQVILLADPDLGVQDCRVEWPDGGAERDIKSLEKQIGEAVQKFLSRHENSDAPDPSSTEF